MPKVSVLTPVYRTNEQQLREAIESILNQTFTDFEFILLDDCPEDSREAVIKEYNDQRIKYLKNEHNLGISAGRNKLIDLASGEYLAIFDHDDISLPERLEKEVKYLDEHPDVGVVSGQAVIFDTKDKSLWKHPSEDKEIKLALISKCALIHSASMIRKSVLTDNNIRYEAEFSPAEDYAMYGRLIGITKFHNLPEPVIRYRDHADNTSHHQKGKMRDADLAIRAFIRHFNPILYYEAELREKIFETVLSVKLFDTLTLLTVKRKGRRSKVYLFGKFHILSCRRSEPNSAQW